MKRILKNLLITILIVFVLNNFILSNVYPVNAGTVGEFLEDVLGTVIGIFTYPVKILAVGLAFATDALVGTVGYSQGEVGSNGEFVERGSSTITPFDILFNKTAITDINFFKVESSAGSNNVIYNIRESIASWYYVMRTIAASILLVVLIYIGIRMAISTVASERALFKKMLVDWIVSLALIFLLQYIAIFTIYANNALVKMIEGTTNNIRATNAETGAAMTAGEAMIHMVEEMGSKAVLGLSINSMAAAVVYVMIIIQTFALLVSYFTRMLKLAFLLIISPLITLTYAVDKIGDGKAQALGNWLKEFVYTVLIQPFHCIIYATFISMALDIISTPGDNNMIVGGIIAILCLRFTKEGEKIVRKIFGFQDDGSAGSIASGMAMSAAAFGMARNIGKGTKTAFNRIGAAKDTLAGAGRDIHAAALAIRMGKEQAKDGDGQVDSFEDRKAAALEQINNNAEAKKQEKQNKKWRTSKRAATESQVNAKADEIMKKNQEERAKIQKENQGKDPKDQKALPPKMTRSQAMARARLAAAQDHRDRIKNDPNAKRKGVAGKVDSAKRKINGFVSSHAGIANMVSIAKDVKNFAKNSDTIKTLKDMTISSGACMFAFAAQLGAGKSLQEAITMGGAVSRGTDEFLKNSTGTIANNINESLQSMGITDQEAARIKLNDIMLNGNAEKYDDDQLYKDALKRIEDQLKAAGLSGDRAKEIRNTIQNTVNKEIKENPGANLSGIVQNALNSKLTSNEAARLTDDQRSNIISAGTDYGTIQQEAEIYKSMTSAAELGVDPNRLIERVASRYEYSGPSRANGEDGENAGSNSGDTPPSDEAIRNALSGLETEQIRHIKQQLDDERAQMERDLEEQKQQLEQIQHDTEMSEEEIHRVEESIKQRIEEIKHEIDDANVRIDQIQEEINRRMREEESTDAENPLPDGPDPINPPSEGE